MSVPIRASRALVTGANRGIGKAIVEALVNRGAAKVYAAVRSPDSARPLVDEFGDRVVPLRFDLTDPESIAAAAEVASDVQIVVNNAGVLRASGPLDEGAEEALDFELETNVYGLLRVARAFAAVLLANGGGALVQLNSVASLKAFPAFATYCATKAASYSLTQALRDALRGQGTLVVSVHPGPIATDMGRHAGLESIAEPASVVADAVLEAIATGRFHVFPDAMARQIGGAYASFAESIVDADMALE